jgi:hypothetical protein
MGIFSGQTAVFLRAMRFADPQRNDAHPEISVSG